MGQGMKDQLYRLWMHLRGLRPCERCGVYSHFLGVTMHGIPINNYCSWEHFYADVAPSSFNDSTV